VSWVGLRGAVPVVLALFPMMYEVDNARLYFNVAFFIVLTSLLLQGATLAPAARWLKLEAPHASEPLQRVTVDLPGHFEHEIVCYQVHARSLAAGGPVAELALPEGVQPMAVIRDGMPQPMHAGVRLAHGDYVYLLARPERLAPLSKVFDPHLEPDRLEAHRYFGDFALNGDAVVGEVAAVYGFAVPEAIAGKTLAQYLDERFHGRAVVGDRAPLGRAELVVRELDGDRIVRIGLRLDTGRGQASRAPHRDGGARQ
jgi:cell volume regulation protein A